MTLNIKLIIEVNTRSLELESNKTIGFLIFILKWFEVPMINKVLIKDYK